MHFSIMSRQKCGSNQGRLQLASIIHRYKSDNMVVVFNVDYYLIRPTVRNFQLKTVK